jgi:hypothetical protein
MVAVAAGLIAWFATPARADDSQTARDIQAAVDTYFSTAQQDAKLVGGPGSAGYDSGFWIRGGDFSLRINLTLQARYEFFKFDTQPNEQNRQGGDLSGFSLPRAVIKFSGTAPCNIRYYVESDAGHWGRQNHPFNLGFAVAPVVANTNPIRQSNNFASTREAWIEWGMSDAVNFRMGQIKTPTTRQLMVAPELQQFVDISMASAVTGQLMPGYTDRNRDHGFMVHGAVGCNKEFSYMVAVTNGDGGDSIRNVLDPLTSDNLAFSGRLNWAFLNAIGYTEGATRFNTCTWYGEIGAWAHYYADRQDMPHVTIADRLAIGGDLALGYGGFSFTGAFTYYNWDAPINAQDEDWIIVLAQLGYHFPDTAWEIAARWSYYDRTIGTGAGAPNPNTSEIAGAINYYLNGHGNKLTLDFSYISATANGNVGGGYSDVYAGVPLGYGSNGDNFLVRFQWQLAL